MAGERVDANPDLASVIAWLEEQRAYCRPAHLADAPAEEVDARCGPCAAYGAVVYGLVIDKLRPLAAAAPLLPGGEEAERLRNALDTMEKTAGASDLDPLEERGWRLAISGVRARLARPDVERAPQEDRCERCGHPPHAPTSACPASYCFGPPSMPVPTRSSEPRPQGDEVETVAKVRGYVADCRGCGCRFKRADSAERHAEYTGHELIWLALDARSGADTVKLADVRALADLVVDVMHGRKHSGELLTAIKPYRSGADRPEGSQT